MKHSEGQEAAKGTCDVGSSVEDGQSAGELATAVKRGLVVDDQWEESACAIPSAVVTIIPGALPA